MSKRTILEDSDSDDDGDNGAPPPAIDSDSFFTSKEKEAIERCNIQINSDTDGKYSEDAMKSAIEQLGEPPLAAVSQGGGDQLYQKYCVKREEKGFFQRDIYTVHDPNNGSDSSSSDVSPSEEAILLEIEAIHRSEKATKVKLFKQKETGGMVVFGPWWNYTLRRLLELSSNKSITADESLGEYTAVKIARALFVLISEGLNEVVKVGKLGSLSAKMGVHWEENAKLARKVIDKCGGSSHYLDKELRAVEAHIQSLKGGKTKPAVAAAAASTAGAAGSASKAQANAADEAKRKSDARKLRMAAMKATARRTNSGIVDTGGAANSTSSPQKAAAMPPAASGGRDSRETGYGRKLPPEDGYGRKPPPEQQRAISDERKPPTAAATVRPPTSTGAPQPLDTRNHSQQALPPARAANGGDDGWGRPRLGVNSRPIKTKGSWKFARKILSHNIPVEEERREAPNQSARGDDHRPPPESSQHSAIIRDDHRGGQGGRGGAGGYNSRDGDGGGGYRDGGGYGRHDSRGSGSDSYPSRHGGDVGRSSSRYDDRSSGRDYRDDHHRGSSRGGDYPRDDYSRSGSSGGRGDYDRDRSCDDYRGREDEYGRSRSRDESSRDYGRSGSGSYSQGSTRSRSQDLDEGEVRPQKRFRGPNEASAPAAAPVPTAMPSGAGRGRGAHINKPAWMTQGGPTGMPTIGSTNPGAGPSEINATSYTAPSAVAPSSGAGMGRGAHVNMPAWKAKQEQNNPVGAAVPGGMPSNIAPMAVAPPSGAGRGRGAHINTPAWMTREQQTAVGSVPPAATMSSAPLVSSHVVANPVGGSGRGRGANVNLPAWMTNPSGQGSAPTGMQPQPQTPSAPLVNQNGIGVNPSPQLGGLHSNGQGRGRGRGRGRGKDVNKPAWMTNPNMS